MCALTPRYIKKIFIQSQNADPSPPLGTILGNLGVNTVSFCTSFNAYTKSLPSFYTLKVTISIFDNKSISFIVSKPTTSSLLNLLKFEKVIKVRMFDRYHDKTILCVSLYSVIKLAKFKFPNWDIKRSVPIIVGTVKSMNLVIVR